MPAGPTYHHANPHRGLGPSPEPIGEVFGHRAPQERSVRGEAVNQLSGASLVEESNLLPQNGGEQRSSQPVHNALTCRSKQKRYRCASGLLTPSSLAVSPPLVCAAAWEDIWCPIEPLGTDSPEPWQMDKQVLVTLSYCRLWMLRRGCSDDVNIM